MRRIVTWWPLWSAALICAIPAAAQEAPLNLTLDQAIDIALRDSYEAKSLAIQLLRAEKNVNAARGRFRAWLRYRH